MTRNSMPKTIRTSILLVFLLLLASCGQYTVGAQRSTLSNMPRGIDQTPEPGTITRVGTPVISASLTFKTSVSYAQALRLVTGLGLQVTSRCGPVWVQTDFKGDYQSFPDGQLPTASTAAAAPHWLDRLKASGDIEQLWVNSWGHCSNSPWALLHAPATLPLDQSGSFVRVTFSNASNYDTVLDTIMMLGFRLANPCYEYLRALNQNPTWTPMGQEASFAASRTLLLATTPSNAVSWKQHLSTTPGVVKVEVAPPIAC